MRWLKPNVRSSFYALLGAVGGPVGDWEKEAMDDVRDSMLAALGPSASRDFTSLCRRIRYADDIVGLWYLRGELMLALATIHGERAASKKIASITAQFEGLLPGSLQSRPSPLM